MSHSREYPTRCDHPGCEAAHPSSKWDDMRAHQQGWFHGMNGSAFCPEHLPPWLVSWRLRRKAAGL